MSWTELASLAAVLLVVYPYVVYPLMLALVPGGRPLRGKAEPRVSVLLSAYNEEGVIDEKIRNFFSLEYHGQRELVIMSDGSTDRTFEIAAKYSGPQVKVMRQARAGKTAALNRMAKEATGELLVFTDANTIFSKDALIKLAEPFSDPAVGVVTGSTVPLGHGNGEGAFYRFERFLKAKESALGIIAGADGAIYAMRKELYTPLDSRDINDLYHPIAASLAGYRSCFIDGAFGYESGDNSMAAEYARQKRMAGQAAALLFRQVPKLASKGRFVNIWVLLSHKVSRWFHLPALLTLLALALASSGLNILAFPVLAYLGLAAAGAAASVAKTRLPVLSLAWAFFVVHAAYFHGLLGCFRSERYVVWNPRGGMAGK